MIRAEKLGKIAYLSFKNALRLHFDSIMLFKNKSYPSAFFLSVLAQEELGKEGEANELAWDMSTGISLDPQDEQMCLSLFYKHPAKQGAFLRYSGLWGFSSLKSLEKTQKVYGGELEKAKQKSVYVGLKKNGKLIESGGKINNPFKIKKAESAKQITIINDHFIDLILGTRLGYYTCENEKIKKVINKRLEKKITSTWKQKSSVLKRKLGRYCRAEKKARPSML
jgi:AbiV family abortive infection protein